MKSIFSLFIFATGLIIIPLANAQNSMALQPDGITGYMSVPDYDDPDIDASKYFTINLWMKSSASSDYYRIVNKRAMSGVNPGYEMINEPGLKASWDFERVSGNTVPDLTGMHPDTLFGGVTIVPAAVEMVFSGSSIITTSLPVGKGELNERLIALNVLTDGFENPQELTFISFTLNGTSDLKDIINLKVYFTAANPRLTTSKLFGTARVIAGTIQISGSQLLNEGSNYFWITADVSPDATEGNFLKGEIKSATVDGQSITLTPGATDDQRQIILEHKLLFSGGDYKSANFRIPAIKTAKDGSLIIAVD